MKGQVEANQTPVKEKEPTTTSHPEVDVTEPVVHMKSEEGKSATAEAMRETITTERVEALVPEKHVTETPKEDIKEKVEDEEEVVPQGRSNFGVPHVDEDESESTATTTEKVNEKGNKAFEVLIEEKSATVQTPVVRTTLPVVTDSGSITDAMPCDKIPGDYVFSFTQSPSAFVESQGENQVKINLKFVAGCGKKAAHVMERRPWTLDQFSSSWLFTDVTGKTCRVTPTDGGSIGSTQPPGSDEKPCSFKNTTQFVMETNYDEPSCKIESKLDVTDVEGKLAGSFKIRLSYFCETASENGEETSAVVVVSALDSPVSIAVRVYEKPNYLVQIGVMSAILLPLIAFVAWVTIRRIKHYSSAKKGLIHVNSSDDTKNGNNKLPYKKHSAVVVFDDDDGARRLSQPQNHHNNNGSLEMVERQPASEEEETKKPLMAKGENHDVDAWKYVDDDADDDEVANNGTGYNKCATSDVEKGC